MFSNHFNVLISKIFFLKKNYYFDTFPSKKYFKKQSQSSYIFYIVSYIKHDIKTQSILKSLSNTTSFSSRLLYIILFSSILKLLYERHKRIKIEELLNGKI